MPTMTTQPIRFAAVGLNHNHIYGQTRMLLAAGAELAGDYSPEDELAAEFAQSYPQATADRSAERDPGRSVDPADRDGRHRQRPGRHRD